VPPLVKEVACCERVTDPLAVPLPLEPESPEELELLELLELLEEELDELDVG